MTEREFAIHTGDCREVMRSIADSSIDAVITDPPYGLGFMGKAWDRGVPGAEFWAEMLRVAKPGAYLLAFGGTRTSHRMACAIEDAGWEIRDTIMWIYGSGFPKSHNGPWGGTALKPAHEPIIMARKKLIGTVSANVLAYGTGALNIDLCRVPATDNVRFEREPGSVSRENWRKGTCIGPAIPTDLGRWP
ncbi:MAG: site-specific DNA-methyltransferase, partial [Bradyrhizobium sp.]|nr:site-specific DNA-methyltransferase [Bradyrhizobium sp.]